MERFRGSARRTPATLLAIAVLSLMAAPAAGQPPIVAPADDAKVFDPSQSRPVPEGTPSGDVVGDEATMTEEDEKVIADETVQQPGWGNARDQRKSVRVDESEEDCAGTPPPTSRMLGFPGTAAASEGDPLGRLILIVAVSALVVAGIAYLVRHRRRDPRGECRPGGDVHPGSRRQGVAGARDHDGDQRRQPAHHAGRVRDETQTRRLPEPDSREVGNVIWLEIHLEGYGDKPLSLQYASFDPDTSGALLPGTAVSVELPHEDVDVETQFVPVWVGYPKSRTFEAAFRLLHEGRVQALAETGEMRGSRYRYSC